MSQTRLRVKITAIRLLFLGLVWTTKAQQLPPGLLGGEKAVFFDLPFVDETYENHTNHRHNFCDLYEQVRTGQLELKDTLRGLQISTVFHRDSYFHYSDKNGIDYDYPGLEAQLMDMIAERAGFTWRNSFAVVGWAQVYGMDWTELLWWEINTYDIAVSWWDHSMERLEMGVAFPEPWYDSSIVLIDKLEGNEFETWNIGMLWNWTRPFDLSVWILICFTIFISGLVYQLIEHMQGEQQDRPILQWFSDNLYLSLLNFTTNFEYAPATAPGRIFAVSMAMWALIITATYTANLASLFVEDNKFRPVVTSIEEAATKGIPICTFQGANSDNLLRKWFKTANRKPQATEEAMFSALESGDCDIATVSISGWRTYRGQKAYNRDCNLQQVGDVVQDIKSGFAVKADVGYQCTSLLRDVISLYLRELVNEGELDVLWQEHRSRIQDNDCDSAGDYSGSDVEGQPRFHENEGTGHRKLRCSQDDTSRRNLKAATRSSSSNEESNGSETSLTLNQMMGTFILHYGMMLLAILASYLSPYWVKWTKAWGWEQPEQLIVRSHGPTIGPAPSMDTSHRLETSCRTGIQAYGRPKRMSINTFVLPESAPVTIKEGKGDFLDEYDDTEFSDIAMSNKRALNKPHVGVNDSASFSHFQEHLDAKLQTTTEQYGIRLSQHEEKMNQQMGMMFEMLNDMKKREEQRDKELLVMLQNVGKQESHGNEELGVTCESPTDHLIEDEPVRRKRDFGRYLRRHS